MKRLRERRRQLRGQATEVERRVWAQLRAKQFAGFKFRRQHPIGPYVVFCCTRQRLVIELDGHQHAELEVEQRDAMRTKFLNRQGYHVIGFGNHEAMRQFQAVRLRLPSRLLDDAQDYEIRALSGISQLSQQIFKSPQACGVRGLSGKISNRRARSWLWHARIAAEQLSGAYIRWHQHPQVTLPPMYVTAIT